MTGALPLSFLNPVIETERECSFVAHRGGTVCQAQRQLIAQKRTLTGRINGVFL